MYFCINKIKSIFSNRKNKEKCFVTFTLEEDKSISCDLNFNFSKKLSDPNNTELAEEYALFLYNILTERNTILKLIVDAMNKQKSKSTVHLLYYNNMTQFFVNFFKAFPSSSSQEPVISPSQVFNIHSEIIESEENE